MRLYRVIYFLEGAAPNDKGGVLYVPSQMTPGRINNPGVYEAFYAGDTGAGVCAEVFYRGKYRIAWRDDMLAPMPNGTRRVLAWYDFPENLPICDLNDPKELIAHKLRPSDVITRDYSITQAWALRIFNQTRYAGVSWWSYCDARWRTYGIWDRSDVTAFGIEELSLKHPAMVEAAGVLQVGIR